MHAIVISGLEVSGRIIEVGPDVTGWTVGDEVCALLAGGGYAERVVVPAGQLLPVPKGVGLVEAAALPEVACTVWSTIVMRGALSAGETLPVHGGAGGSEPWRFRWGRHWGREWPARSAGRSGRSTAGVWGPTK